MEKLRFQMLDHTTDAGISAVGSNLGELFETCAIGMMTVMFGNFPVDIQGVQSSKTIEISGACREDLLAGFLSEIIFVFDVEGLAPISFTDITVGEESLRAKIRMGKPAGDDISPTEIKAVTYHRMKIIEKDGLFMTDVVFDL